MTKPAPRRPSFGLVIGALGVLMLVSGGSAYAAAQITSAQIKDNTVQSADIKNDSLKAVDIAPNAITGSELKDGAVSSKDVLDQSLTGDDVGQLNGDADIIDNTITTFDIGNDAIDSDEVLDFGLTNQDVGVLFAQVAADGTIDNSSGDVTGIKLGTGNYEVDFKVDVSPCAFTATIGPSGGGSAQGELNVADRSGNANAVFVDTNDSDGTAADKPFNLMVVC